MYHVVYRMLEAYSRYPGRVYEKYVDISGLRELIDWIDESDDVELISLRQLHEDNT